MNPTPSILLLITTVFLGVFTEQDIIQSQKPTRNANKEELTWQGQRK